jgi:RND superfamily putative drug exporter
MFEALGRLIGKRAGWVVAAWVAVAVVASVWAFRASRPPEEMAKLLPDYVPFSQASENLRVAFPKQAALSSIVIIVRRPAGLTSRDIDWLAGVTQAAGEATERRIVSPGVAFLRPRLVSRDNQAAIGMVNLSSYLISPAATKAVNATEAIIKHQPPPPGLTVELTGSAAIGRDYAAATRKALDHTTWVTIIAVLTILILVYRSPVGAFVPLIAIGLSVYLAIVALTMLQKWLGWEFSSMERIFVVVLLFGAGVDYALFWIARYRESHQGAMDLPAAAMVATRHAGPAVLFSAITTMIGMCSLLFAELGASRASGRVLLVALAMALLAGLTLAPAISRLLGKALFWPIGPTARPTLAQRKIWPALAGGIVRAPVLVLVGGLLVLATPAALALRMQPRFDSISELPEGTSSKCGYDIAEAHFSKGQLYPNKLLFTFDKLPGHLTEASAALRERILKMRGVDDVYSLDSPLGRNLQVPKQGFLAGAMEFVTSAAEPYWRDYYVSAEHPAMQMEILVDYAPFTPEAMKVMDQVREIAAQQAERWAQAGVGAHVYLGGLTPYIMAVRDVSERDQRLVMILATVFIAIVVLALIRDVPLAAFMVFSTLLTYGATLKFTELFFVHVMGLHGIDWKVRLIVFVIVVAVGQDYNIFLVSRLMEERRRAELGEAVRRAVVRTGAVISSCGIIMAATLGSLWAGRLSLLRQVGFALALGILIDTYFVRPILIPSFFLVVRGWHRAPAGEGAVTDAPLARE